MPDQREPWALILGASSGFGEATAVALAEDGYNIAGVHLDRRQAQPHLDELAARIRGMGREIHLFNINAADDAQRASVLESLRSAFEERRSAGREAYVRVLLHSLAFGTLKPFLSDDPANAISRRNMEMTLDVMAHSLVYWAQDLWRGGYLGDGSKVYAMTSEGSTRVVASYGAVSAAKCALESHCRQLSMEFARLGSGVTVNAVRAGVTMTPALMQIPERDALIEHATKRNPNGRMTTVDDVARAIVTLARDGTHWITGNVLGIDGGELIAG